MEVIMEDDAGAFNASLGELSPTDIEKSVQLITTFGTMYNEEAFIFSDAWYDIELKKFIIRVRHDD